MQIIDETIDNIKVFYPLESVAPLEQILFIDIETTGFTARTSKLYLIGCLYYRNGWKSRQFFADEYSDEMTVVEEFFDFAKSFKVLIHYNGNNFDIPYLTAKSREFSLSYDFDEFVVIDIYRRISPYKN
ncbi:MAG: ribonuclease H-like domain-containing protein, partial [Lachnospiraceae bacterium]|nr:ribonuclease H-like domain-containing protein [Lachnospiraceae bacterium]